ncbi:hypothetical protein M1P56_33230 [Streptomyces sp. HU2014]|uniref:Uncharacterized protein n=1 Tax=Streptomyces albireticuli TaxID=1940 RepID=A0A1Z2L3Q2_9ACTN|nr:MULTISPECIES: hypothetical protein [Streptomyces]ARZ68932.1 hypothetical protein SMD11_3295 [Streptomyces albireticuli]UQI48832.1 hypothetical protein M1P56_33230 [Streptomyces sp. HU2014]
MTKPRLRALALALAVTSLAASAAFAPQAAGAARAPAGTPVTLCLTDASAAALSAARIGLEAVPPSTLVTENGHACVRTTVETGRINPGSSSGTGAAGEGGFAFRRGQRRAAFENLAASVMSDKIMITSAVHRGRRIDVLASPTARLKLYLTKVSAEDIPMNLTPAGAEALAAAFTTGPLPAGGRLFTGSTGFDVLEQTTGLLGGLGQRLGLG